MVILHAHVMLSDQTNDSHQQPLTCNTKLMADSAASIFYMIFHAFVASLSFRDIQTVGECPIYP